MTIDIDNAVALRGRNLHGTEGEKIGTIEEVYLDADTDQPEWLAVKTGLFGSKLSFVPVAGVDHAGDDVRVPYTKDQIKSSPNVDPDRELSQSEEAELYRHYGLDYSEHKSESGLPSGSAGTTDYADTTTGHADTTTGRGPVGNDVSGPETDEAMTRSEEELRVGTTQREAGRARLRKYIVTENVTKTVPVQREEVRLEREPITDANIDQATSGPELSEEEHELTLNQEEAVVEKRVVPKERVRLDKDVVTEEQTVNESVAKEQIEAEGDLDRR